MQKRKQWVNTGYNGVHNCNVNSFTTPLITSSLQHHIVLPCNEFCQHHEVNLTSHRYTSRGYLRQTNPSQRGGGALSLARYTHSPAFLHTSIRRPRTPGSSVHPHSQPTSDQPPDGDIGTQSTVHAGHRTGGRETEGGGQHFPPVPATRREPFIGGDRRRRWGGAAD